MNWRTPPNNYINKISYLSILMFLVKVFEVSTLFLNLSTVLALLNSLVHYQRNRKQKHHFRKRQANKSASEHSHTYFKSSDLTVRDYRWLHFRLTSSRRLCMHVIHEIICVKTARLASFIFIQADNEYRSQHTQPNKCTSKCRIISSKSFD